MCLINFEKNIYIFICPLIIYVYINTIKYHLNQLCINLIIN